MLVYFVYPQAHEDDAERAVQAGLELIAAVAALGTHVPLQIRIGIATGACRRRLLEAGRVQEHRIVAENACRRSLSRTWS